MDLRGGIKSTEIEGERVDLKKDFAGWKVVYPIQNEDGSWNYKNLFLGGSWWNLLKVLVIVLMLMFLMFSYYHDSKVFRDIQENPCEYVPLINKMCEQNKERVTLGKIPIETESFVTVDYHIVNQTEETG